VQLSLKPIKNKALQATDLKQLCSFFFSSTILQQKRKKVSLKFCQKNNFFLIGFIEKILKKKKEVAIPV